MTQRHGWIPTATLIPFIYILGWSIAQSISVFGLEMEEHELSLIGTIISFIAFFIVLPSWFKFRWNDNHWAFTIGLNNLSKGISLKYFYKGFLLSVFLILCVSFFLVFSSWGKGIFVLNSSVFFNAIFLGLGVGFAEEIIFRGWLFCEMNQLLGPRNAVLANAAIFSLVHVRLDLDFLSLFGLMIGLFLLGLVLCNQRKMNEGSLWGCIGLHGGLVGIWFVFATGLIKISPNTPSWLFGPGGSQLNPIGGLIAILLLLLILWNQRIALAMAGPPLSGACKDSSKGAFP